MVSVFLRKGNFIDLDPGHGVRNRYVSHYRAYVLTGLTHNKPVMPG